MLGVGREGPRQVAAADLEDEQEEVREGRGVLVVARVQRAVEHRDRPGDEVLGLVGVVGEGQAVVEVPEPQPERDEQDDRDGGGGAEPRGALAGGCAHARPRRAGLGRRRRVHAAPQADALAAVVEPVDPHGRTGPLVGRRKKAGAQGRS